MADPQVAETAAPGTGGSALEGKNFIALTPTPRTPVGATAEPAQEATGEGDLLNEFSEEQLADLNPRQRGSLRRFLAERDAQIAELKARVESREKVDAERAKKDEEAEFKRQVEGFIDNRTNVYEGQLRENVAKWRREGYSESAIQTGIRRDRAVIRDRVKVEAEQWLEGQAVKGVVEEALRVKATNDYREHLDDALEDISARAEKRGLDIRISRKALDAEVQKAYGGMARTKGEVMAVALQMYYDKAEALTLGEGRVKELEKAAAEKKFDTPGGNGRGSVTFEDAWAGFKRKDAEWPISKFMTLYGHEAIQRGLIRV